MEVAGNGAVASPASQQSLLAKRKFFQWAVKWFYANVSEDVEEKPDAPVLACLLQSIGFQLREFERKEDTQCEERGEEESRKEKIRVTIECGSSGMRACLEMDDVKCRCPNPQDTKDASFWSITGTGPTATLENSNKVKESGSNLLPPVSKETKKVLNEVIHRLLGMITDKPSTDVNQNNPTRSNLNLSRMGTTKEMMDTVNEEFVKAELKKESLSFFRSRTQPEILVTGMNTGARRYNMVARSAVKESISGVPGLMPKIWGDTFDYESGSIDGDQPRPSPPKIASSPVVLNQLCSSLGQLSLQSEEEAGNLADHVIRAYKTLEKAVEILVGRKSPVSKNTSGHEERTFLTASENVLNVTNTVSQKKSCSTVNLRVSPSESTSSRPGSSCSMPGRVLSSSTSSKQSLCPKKSPMTRRSVGSALSKLSTTPLSSVAVPKKNQQSSSSSGVSKIPGRRKSLGSRPAQPLKLVPLKPKNSSGKKVPPSPSREEQSLAVNESGASEPKPIQKPGNTLTRPSGSSATAPTSKLTPLKALAPAKDATTRKSIGPPKFGFCNKKP